MEEKRVGPNVYYTKMIDWYKEIEKKAKGTGLGDRSTTLSFFANNTHTCKPEPYKSITRGQN